MYDRYRVYLHAKGEGGIQGFKFKIGWTDELKVARNLAKGTISRVDWGETIRKDSVTIAIYDVKSDDPTKAIEVYSA